MELTQLESIDLFIDTVTSQTVWLNVLFPSKYRYYLELVSIVETPIVIDHPFRLYFPQTIMVDWADLDGKNGIYLILDSTPEFMPFGPLTVQVYIPLDVYNAITMAMENPIGSLAELVPPPEGNACGEVGFVLLSTETGDQIKIDLVNTSYTPEIPVTVQTLQWNEVLYDVMNLPSSPLLPPPLLPPPLLPPPPTFPSFRAAVWGSGVFNAIVWNSPGQVSSLPSPPTTGSLNFEFAYTISGDLGITFIDPRYCFLREWITFPPAWTEAIKNFAGIA